ncbi:hypothetical protein G6F35_014722 [Rhizopus arrhizus]|nr:hypothetical protein G6F35_014722 [Rhizopus arrhizus]
MAISLVLVQAVLRLPEARFQQLPGLVHPLAGLLDAGLQRAAVGQQHEGHAIAVVHVVLDLAIAQGPGIAAGGRVAVHLTQVAHAVLDRLAIFGIAELAVGHRVVEDEARAAHQVAMAGIVDAAVVTEVVEEATVRIDAARVVERHRVGDVRTQERG